jgi:uncharacterized iron-regulated membrane protein
MLVYKLLNRWSRKLHRYGAIGLAIPLLLVIVTGLLLQVKKQWTWVQPPTLKGGFSEDRDLREILEISTRDQRAEIQTWDDIDRLDVRPSKGVVKVQAENGIEIQIDLKTGEILQSTYRRSDWIESLHDGSFFGDWAKLSIFLVNGLVLLGLWISGMYLWYLPIHARSKKRNRSKPVDSNSGSQ